MNKIFKAIITIIRISIGCIALIFIFSYLVSALDPEVKELYWGAKEDFSITILYFVFLGLLLLIGFYKEFLFILKELGFKDFVTKTTSIAKSVSNNMLSFLKKNKRYLIIGLGTTVILILFLYPMWEEKIKYTLYNRCINNNEIKTEKFKNKVESKKDACFSTGEPDINVRRKCYDEVLKFEKETNGKNERNCYAIIKDIQIQNRMFKSR